MLVVLHDCASRCSVELLTTIHDLAAACYHQPWRDEALLTRPFTERRMLQYLRNFMCHSSDITLCLVTLTGRWRSLWPQ